MTHWVKRLSRALLIGASLMAPATLLAADSATSVVGAGGYDLVSYHTGAKPLRGNGNHVAVHDGVTYLFASQANRQQFEATPEKYLPAYGGYCAYGVAIGKKFVGDPDVWEIVDGTLYLNLDNKIKGLWLRDVAGHITKANAHWPRIETKLPSQL
jgi:YHS domain-containing protein